MQQPPPDRSEAPSPPPATTFEWTPELASGRVPGAAPAPDPVHRVRRTIAWLVGLVVVLWIASITISVRDGAVPSDAFESGRQAGRVVGTALSAFLIAFVLWGVRAVFARRGGRRRLLLSPMVPSLAVVIALVGLIGVSRPAAVAGSAVVPGSPSPSVAAAQTLDEALAIGKPYTLEAPSAAEESAVLTQMQLNRSSYKSLTVRRILHSGSFDGYAFIAETDLRPGAEAFAIAAIEMAFSSGASSNPGWTKSRTQVNDHEVVTVGSSDGVVAMWAEPPFVKLIVALDRSTLDSVVANFVNP
jgi:hypothetical protein